MAKKFSLPPQHDAYRVDEEKVERLIAEGYITADFGKKLLFHLGEEQNVVMVIVNKDGEIVSADLQPESIAIKRYGRGKVIGS